MKKAIIFTAILFLYSAAAHAVTYRNDGTGTVVLKDTFGIMRTIAPGETVATYTYSDDTNLTKIADTPYYNRVVSVDSVTLSSTAADVAVSLDTDEIIVTQITGAVTVYIQAEANTPAELADWTSDDPVIIIPADRRFDNLSVKGSGTCTITQYRVVD